ncbi:hydroxymethylglutaryl-CoA synthase [Cooperia oncophora]
MSPGVHPIQDVGISAIEIYFPKNVVNQTDLEKVRKYTVGLGQDQMGFCADNEDVVSISLTVTDALLRKYYIEPSSIGFLAVGTETLIDKSKSVKTELMRLFGDNSDIEGVDVKNACFGGTQAVFHAIDWVYANYSTEKRNAIAVLADIAVYEPGPARSTGAQWRSSGRNGAGAIAVLITPDAPIVFDRGLRASYMASSWDFYKPIGRTSTEYPIVDGPVSLQSYMNALDNCYVRFRQKALNIYGEEELGGVGSGCFSLVILSGNVSFTIYAHGAEGSSATFLQSSFENREVMNCLLCGSESLWNQKVNPFLVLNRRIGNMYTPSLFAQLVAYLASGVVDDLSRLLFFAYGSGSASAMFSASIRDRNDEHLIRMREVCRTAVG